MPPTDASPRATLDRRRFLAIASSLAALPALAAAAEAPAAVPAAALAAAEKLLGLELTDAERALMAEGLAEQLGEYQAIRAVPVANDVPPAVAFSPLLPGARVEQEPLLRPTPLAAGQTAPERLEDAAFWPVTSLGALVRDRQVRSTDLTQMYLQRLRRLDPVLHFAVTVTEELAMRQAEAADAEIAAGRWRGPLHGIPWGAKDLLAARGYPTTWGSVPFREQVVDEDATVVERLGEAGAVLVAKLSLGELAWGDVWFGGMTRSPWDVEQGSSGSSAGSAAATAAGALGFAIGSETLGSIVSPSTRNGATGLRPTFGRVSRHGAMALAWSMDKLGPICRSVEDCALVLAAIHGPDGRDPSVVAAPFRWDAAADVQKLRVGYVKALFDAPPAEGNEEAHTFALATLDALRGLGIELVEIALPGAGLPDGVVSALSLILTAEAAAAFDELTRSGRDDQLVRQVAQAWPNVFRLGQTVPAVSYIQANRVRTLLMREMAELFSRVDVYVTPSFGGNNLLLTNLTGHPAVVLPNGFRKNGTPTSITFTSGLFREGDALRVAKAYQDATGFHLRRPPVDTFAPTPAFPPEKPAG
jgi:Asp-tRNA(Asn)/Glu-tRNA(Gln) amidotransferase A subunit family amidase